mgnify:CR=1 FL=1
MGKYAVRESKSKFYFNLKADNGEIILTSEGYNREASCLQGVESVRTNAAVASVEDQTIEGFKKETNPKFEMYADKAGEFRFRLKARNGQIIGVSEGYKAKASAVKGIESIRKNSASDVVKVAIETAKPAKTERVEKMETVEPVAEVEKPVKPAKTAEVRPAPKIEKAVKTVKAAKAEKTEESATMEAVGKAEKTVKAPKKRKKA